MNSNQIVSILQGALGRSESRGAEMTAPSNPTPHDGEFAEHLGEHAIPDISKDAPFAREGMPEGRRTKDALPIADMADEPKANLPLSAEAGDPPEFSHADQVDKARTNREVVIAEGTKAAHGQSHFGLEAGPLGAASTGQKASKNEPQVVLQPNRPLEAGGSAEPIESNKAAQQMEGDEAPDRVFDRVTRRRVAALENTQLAANEARLPASDKPVFTKDGTPIGNRTEPEFLRAEMLLAKAPSPNGSHVPVTVARPASESLLTPQTPAKSDAVDVALNVKKPEVQQAGIAVVESDKGAKISADDLAKVQASTKVDDGRAARPGPEPNADFGNRRPAVSYPDMEPNREVPRAERTERPTDTGRPAVADNRMASDSKITQPVASLGETQPTRAHSDEPATFRTNRIGDGYAAQERATTASTERSSNLPHTQFVAQSSAPQPERHGGVVMSTPEGRKLSAEFVTAPRVEKSDPALVPPPQPTVSATPPQPTTPPLSAGPPIAATPIFASARALIGDKLLDGERALTDAALSPEITNHPTGPEKPTIGRDFQFQPSRIIAAIAEAARSLTVEKQLEIRLNPEELGRVRLGLQNGEQGMSVVINVERPETLDLLRRNIDMLAQQLRDLGYEDLAFSFSQDWQGGERSAEDEPPHENQRQSFSEFRSVRPELAVQRAALEIGTDGRVDIRL